jgi:hypothetical protein
MDNNANQAAREAQDSQMAALNGMAEFVRVLAELLSKLSGQDIKLNDLTLKSGTKKVWPSSEENIELTAKLKNALIDPESKASFRVMLEYADGSKVEIFRQTAGKVIMDEYGLAPALRAHFAVEDAAKFAEVQRPKIVIEADGLADTANSAQSSAQKNESANVEPAAFVPEASNIEPPKKNQPIKISDREAIANAIPLTAAEHTSIVGEIQEKAKLNELANQNSDAAPIKEQSTQTPTPTISEYKAASLWLADIKNSASKPGMEYLLQAPWVMELEAKVTALQQQLGIVQPQVNQDPITDTPVAQAKTVALDDEITQLGKQIYADLGGDVADLTPDAIEAKTQAVSARLDIPISQAQRNEAFVLDAIAASIPDSLLQITSDELVNDVLDRDWADVAALSGEEFSAQPSLTVEQRNEAFVMNGVRNAALENDSPLERLAENAANMIVAKEIWAIARQTFQ